ncbi:NAD(P)H-dependent oxidoreductase [Leptospira interrogans]|nr:NAD(P)H-dependent oxidoreductase [Leptospira interrogans]MCW3821386.1 NAD(P)H-dependent oxidoreductase [Leptospira interrogans]MDC2811952.1 NAD(P)H-dependent oxidoreductase [Leptospira interrogans]
MICTPEYAHNMPGVLKNSLDWVVGSGEYVNKPVMATQFFSFIYGRRKGSSVSAYHAARDECSRSLFVSDSVFQKKA